MPAAQPRHTPEELARLGSEAFEQHVRPKLRPEDDDRFVAIDIASGDHEIDEDDYAAVTRLRTRRPRAEIWLGRVGQPAAYRIPALMDFDKQTRSARHHPALRRWGDD